MAKSATRSRATSVAPLTSLRDSQQVHNAAAVQVPKIAHIKRASSASPQDILPRPLPRRSPRLSNIEATRVLAEMVSELSVDAKRSCNIELVISTPRDAGLVVSDKRLTAAGEEYRVELWLPKARLTDFSDEIASFEASRS
ncbi:hypothetical protein EYB25_009343 [Talaromyces marneffei]|uniref:uncharacterized protein n=1 Tax=Talaromyces marneffei TaxID=37727 RepID=UPI0012A8D940|nr:uncharacterized protein EYB26_010015 [Talaromyces marneffei]KAE8548960.1 hypothetical protein EYB25_009343 [Talaromyces marneffei]QGA22299.1 hypothetical protein EYB26_010015 [Talaromyces marneffei]